MHDRIISKMSSVVSIILVNFDDWVNALRYLKYWLMWYYCTIVNKYIKSLIINNYSTYRYYIYIYLYILTYVITVIDI